MVCVRFLFAYNDSAEKRLSQIDFRCILGRDCSGVLKVALPSASVRQSVPDLSTSLRPASPPEVGGW